MIYVERGRPLLQLEVAEGAVGVVGGGDGPRQRLRVHLERLLVVALHEEAVALLLELGRGCRRAAHL